jgi:hypothetical protein
MGPGPGPAVSRSSATYSVLRAAPSGILRGLAFFGQGADP